MSTVASPAQAPEQHPAPVVHADDVLDKVVNHLPIGTWRYNGEPLSTYHLGPYAQGWARLFGMNPDDTVIPVVDALGVCLLSAQALGRRVQRVERVQARQRWLPVLVAAAAFTAGAVSARRRAQ